MKHTVTTIERARAASKQVGAVIIWRPSGILNPYLPEMDDAIVVEG